MSKVKNIFPVLEMSCAACAVCVESIVAGQSGVLNASVNYADQTLQAKYDNTQVNPQVLQKAVQVMGYDLIITVEHAAEKQQLQYQQIRKDTIGAGILAFPVFLLGMFFPDFPNAKWIIFALSAPVVFWFGRRFSSMPGKVLTVQLASNNDPKIIEEALQEAGYSATELA